MKTQFLIILSFCIANTCFSQFQFITKDAEVTFFSEAPLENISALNKSLNGVIDIEKGTFLMKIPVNKFIFESDLMEEHFNENYMESEKYPHSTFKGSFSEKITLNEEKEYTLLATGTLTIHGVGIKREIPVKLSWKSQKKEFITTFTIKLKDHTIDIPQLLFKKIAEEVEVTIKSELIAIQKK
ncbi:MAG: YceI family protein [Chitinophagaceae bacterium]|nr:YceI family protein [Chitinophagaceae bacterium]